MRVRVITRGMRGLWYVRRLFNPLRYPFVSLQLLSHKVMRWLIAPFLCVLFASNLWLLDGPLIYTVALVLQVTFYVTALLGILAERFNMTTKVLSIPLYFVTVNAAAVVAMYRIWTGHKAVTWETIRR